MWDYSKKMLDHFHNPRNFGKLKNPNAVGEVGSIACGDALRLELKIDKQTNRIIDARFKTFGCGSAIASSSALTELIKGKTIDEALMITNEDIVNYLGGLPKEKMHCSVMGREALEAAIANYRGESPKKVEVSNIICQCFGVTEEKIKRVILESHLTTVEEVTNYTKAGGGCGNCIPDIQNILDDIWKNKGKEQRIKTVIEKKKLTNIEKIKLIQQTIENEIKPSLKADGGDIELIDVEGNKVFVSLRGICSGCVNAQITLKNFVEIKLREFVTPELTVEEVS